MGKKRPEIKFVKPSKRDLEVAAQRLRYMDPRNIAKDFPGKKERAAIAAVLRWLSLSSTTAWRGKNPHHFSVIARSSRVNRKIGTWNAIVMEKEVYERVQAILLPKPKTASRTRRETPRT